jgi:N-acetylglucosamine-6-phosphate deacetylase
MAVSTPWGSRTATRTLLAGADLVLPDRVAASHTLVVEHGRIVEVSGALRTVSAGEDRRDLTGHIIVPGFIDVHVHGLSGRDVQDGTGAVAAIASMLPRYGVTAFCPTTVACSAADLSIVLDEIRTLRAAPPTASARVLPAHLESNFINQDFAGAQPIHCLRMPPRMTSHGPWTVDDDVMQAVLSARPDVAIMTVAPELAGGLEFVRALAATGIIVSMGHSAAGYDTALAAIAAGARQATHLFNRMTPMTARDPGMVGAVLSTDDVCAELICDGHHVHPAVMRTAVAAKTPSRVMAITDGTAGSGLPRGATALLGGRRITVGDVARLDDQTIAGSVLTMDRAFACLVGQAGAGLVDGVRMCSTTPARELGLQGHGVLALGATADFVVLDANLQVRQTWIGGELVFDAFGA